MEGNELVERCDERLLVLPRLVVVQRAIVGIPERERLMVVTMKAQLPTHLQEHAAKVAELRGIGLARGLGLVNRVLVVLDHHAGIANVVLLRELLQIGPPDLDIKVGDGKPVVALDVGAITRGHGAGKVVQVEYGAVDDRISCGIAQQANRRSVEAAHDLVVDADVTHHGATAAAFVRPNERDTRIAGRCPDARRIAQRYRKRRIKGVRELVALSPTQHKVLARHDTFCSHVFVARRFNAKLGGNHLQVARIIRRHGEHERAAGAHPAHDVGQVRTERIERRHQ